MRRNSKAGLIVVQAENSIGCATHLKRAGFLKIFAFKEERGTRQFIQIIRGAHGRTPDDGFDPFMSL
jgi:hypothetical protein